MSSTLGASLLRTVLSDGTLKILGSGLDKGPIIRQAAKLALDKARQSTDLEVEKAKQTTELETERLRREAAASNESEKGIVK